MKMGKSFKFENIYWDYSTIVDRTPWITATLLNNWSSYSSDYNTCAYKKIGNQVFLKGMVKSNTILSTNTRYILQLPEGYRPPKRTYLIGAYNGNPQLIIVYTDGRVFPDTSNYEANRFVTLDGLSFFVE